MMEKNYALLTDSHAIKLIGGGELTAKGGNATNQSISTEASYPQYISYGVNGPWQDGKVITIDMEASGKFNAIGGDITTNIGAVSNGFSSDLKMLKGTLTAKGGNVTAGEGESRRSSGLYCESKPTILGGKIAASAGSVSPASDNNRSAMEFHSGISAETLEAANITGTTVPESPNPVSYCKLTQSGADPVVISFGPSISVSKVKVSEQDVANPVYGTAQSAKDFFKVETENFEGTPTLKLQWKSGDTWSESAPTGITASFVGGVISIGTTDTLNAGEYEFRIPYRKT